MHTTVALYNMFPLEIWFAVMSEFLRSFLRLTAGVVLLIIAIMGLCIRTMVQMDAYKLVFRFASTFRN